MVGEILALFGIASSRHESVLDRSKVVRAESVAGQILEDEQNAEPNLQLLVKYLVVEQKLESTVEKCIALDASKISAGRHLRVVERRVGDLHELETRGRGASLVGRRRGAVRVGSAEWIGACPCHGHGRYRRVGGGL